jgi:C1A family cysteine protease
MSRRRHYYGWRPDSYDPRDHLFVSLLPEVKIEIPTSVDLTSQCSPVENQKDLGSCTANALAGAVEFLEIKAGAPFMDASRLFIYYNERELEGTVCSDSGAEIRDGIKTLAKDGVCSEVTWPYLPERFTKKPTKKCYKEALDHRIIKYYKIASIEGMKQCLAMGFPFVFGFAVFESFESKEVFRTGIMPLPDETNEQLLGGHAVMAVGFDDKTSMFKIRNSWGTDFGDKGHFYMPYEFITDKRYCGDFWMICKEMC